MNRGLMIAFVASLVLNVFAVGFVSGRLIALAGCQHAQQENPEQKPHLANPHNRLVG